MAQPTQRTGTLHKWARPLRQSSHSTPRFRATAPKTGPTAAGGEFTTRVVRGPLRGSREVSCKAGGKPTKGGHPTIPATLEKPKIQCRYRNDEGWQCPLDALENEEYWKFHLPE